MLVWAARCKITSTPTTRSRSARVVMSPWKSSTGPAAGGSGDFSPRNSRRTRSPRATIARTKLEPRSPAPPVIRNCVTAFLLGALLDHGPFEPVVTDFGVVVRNAALVLGIVGVRGDVKEVHRVFHGFAAVRDALRHAQDARGLVVAHEKLHGFAVGGAVLAAVV